MDDLETAVGKNCGRSQALVGHGIARHHVHRLFQLVTFYFLRPA